MPAVWSRSQRIALAVLALSLVILAGMRYWMNPLDITDPQNAPGTRAGELASRLDPNTADWPSLAVIPGMGEKRARGIVEYRTQFLVQHPDQKAFSCPDDLQAVKGIGPATVSNIEKYLLFPPSPPKR